MTNPYAPPRAAVNDVVDVQGQAVLADPGTRLGAAILDTFIFGAMVYLPIILITYGLAVASGDNDAAAAAMGFAGFGLAAVGFVVWCVLTIKYLRRNGQSIAKKLVGIKIIRTNGTPVSVGRVFWLRNVVNGLLGIIPLYGLIEVLFIFGESRQCLHDKIADTIVVKA
jgi:uncharacterized RDD family membrane protein YckC